jgi:uncharacterized protein (DUF302 family)
MNSEMVQTSYAYSKVVSMSLEEAIEHVTEELKKEGFGILTKIDVKETLKQKLDVTFKPYTILGACNPHYAYQALQEEEEIGLMLPCNVIVYVNVQKKTVISAIDPMASMLAIENPQLTKIAKEVQNKLKSIITKI